ncbi:MAG: rhodanese-like domain-containing protein [Bacteroidetes bacterium]|nr:rhodanese-like domain-containing protein [Bacteroidota bacterium]
MVRRFVIIILIFMGCLVALRAYTSYLPDYGLEKWWKVLIIEIPIHKNIHLISERDAHENANKFLFLDARTWNEYLISHISHAQFTGIKNFDISEMSKVPKETPIIVYSSIGIRSDELALKLNHAGYTNVQNLYGGIFEWLNSGYTIVNKQNTPTKNIHGGSHLLFFWKLKGNRFY